MSQLSVLNAMKVASERYKNEFATRTLEKNESLSYEHKNMLLGDKTVNLHKGDTFSTACVVSKSRSLIPTNGVNQPSIFESGYMGIKLTKQGNVYHAVGTAESNFSVTFLYDTTANTPNSLSAGTSLSMVTFCTQQFSAFTMQIDFKQLDDNGNMLTGGYTNCQIGKGAYFTKKNISVLDGAKYLYFYLTFKAGQTIDCDIAFAVLPTQDTDIVNFDNGADTLVKTVTNTKYVLTLPYQSEISYDVPLKDYIDNFASSSKGYSVTPESFGAVGDGVTDDTDAIKSAIVYAKENKTGLELSGNYATSDTLVVSCDRFICTGKIAYSGNGYAIEYQGGMDGHFEISEIESKAGSGVHVYSSDSSTDNLYLRLGKVTAKDIGIYFHAATGKYLHYTSLYIDHEVRGETAALKLYAEKDGAIREIRIYGGRLSTSYGWAIYTEIGKASTADGKDGFIAYLRIFGTNIETDLYLPVVEGQNSYITLDEDGNVLRTDGICKGIRLDSVAYFDMVGRFESSPVVTPIVLLGACTHMRFSGYSFISSHVDTSGLSDTKKIKINCYDIKFDVMCMGYGDLTSGVASWTPTGGYAIVGRDKRIYWKDVDKYTSDISGKGTEDNIYDLLVRYGSFPTTFIANSKSYIKLPYTYHQYGIEQFFVKTSAAISGDNAVHIADYDGAHSMLFDKPNTLYRVDFYNECDFVINELGLINGGNT